MIVLSVNAPLVVAMRVSRTGMRTGVAFGKNFASLVVELSRAGAAAAPDLDTECLIPDSKGGPMRPGFPSPPVSVAQAPGPHRKEYCTSQAKAQNT